MSVYRNAQFGMSAPESAYGTAATIDRRMPYTGDLSGDLQPADAVSEVLDSGAVARSDASYRPVKAGTLTYPFEPKGSGFGRLYKAAFGAGTSTLVSTGLYQQNFTLGDGPLFDSFTGQACRPLTDGTFENDTFLGMTVSSIEFKIENAGVLTATAELDFRDMVTNVAKASLSRVVANRFTFGGFTLATGTVTEPTSSALASALTPLVDVRSWSLKVENNIVADDYRADGTGLKSQPSVLVRKVTGEFEARFTPAIQALRTNWISNTPFSLVPKFTAGTADVHQFVTPSIRITEPPTPNMDGEIPTIKFSYEVLDNGTATKPFWLVVRTADAAL